MDAPNVTGLALLAAAAGAAAGWALMASLRWGVSLACRGRTAGLAGLQALRLGGLLLAACAAGRWGGAFLVPAALALIAMRQLLIARERNPP